MSVAQIESKIADTPLDNQPQPTALDVRERLVIVGFGMVSHKLVEQIVALEALDKYAVTVIGEEPHFAYDRIRLTELIEHREADRLTLAPRDWYRDVGVDVITGNPVVSIDRENRSVKTANGKRLPYDRLVLATGSVPFVPPIEGASEHGVFVYRTIADLELARAMASQVSSAIVLGGGLLGLEAAHALSQLGLEVTVVEAAPHLMSRQLDASGAAVLGRKIREMGMRTIVDVRARRIQRRGEVLVMEYGEGEQLKAGMIVLAVGVRPRDELARHAELPIGAGLGGIVVNNELQTSDPRIFAIGECAWHNGTVYGLAAPGYRMAESLAKILVGKKSQFLGVTPSTRLKLMGVDVFSLGEHNEPGEEISWRQPGSYRQITLKGGRLVGASAVGEWPEIGFTQHLISKRRRVWPWQKRRFSSNGTFARNSQPSLVSQWPADAVVCNCMSVTRGVLTSACSRSCASIEALVKETGASTVCGSCRPLLAELAGDTTAPPALKGRLGLLILAAAAFVIAVAIVVTTPFAPASSVRLSDVWDLLYRDGWWRQATGFSLLGCSLGASALSLRKRWNRIQIGSFDCWRVIHAAIGVVALVTLVAHTGMRLGGGFNQVLMIAFLSVNVVGAAAAVGLGRRFARLTFWLHAGTTWPLPVLIGFHVLSVYYF